MDLLVVDQGSKFKPPTHFARTPWEELVSTTQPSRKPRLVIETWPASAQMWSKGPMSKARIATWTMLGYETRCKVVRATDVGGAIRQDRLLVARVQHTWSHLWKWDATEAATEVVRPMSNLLTPPGLVSKKLYDRCYTRHPPDARTDPMPEQAGAWIRTENGVRRLSLDETSRGLGLPKEMTGHLSPSLLRNTTSLFHFEYLSPSLVSPVVEPLFKGNLHNPDVPDAKESQPRLVFHWNPPDLSEGSTWYNDRVRSLRIAVSTLPNPTTEFAAGLELLRIHRGNYTATGPAPRRLQLLWWEFPPEHWTPLREGSPMNFLVEPVPRLNPNAHMDSEQLVVAAGFVDELLELSILLAFAEGKEFLMNAPLFVVPKEGQEGEWRVIADMLRGGQNSCMGSDPVFLPRSSHILDQMYQGGYSAVVDASKFFYQFTTHPDDRPFLGLLHPTTGIMYAYGGLPMGAGSSPCLAGRYGLSLLRMLRQQCTLFQGTVTSRPTMVYVSSSLLLFCGLLLAPRSL